MALKGEKLLMFMPAMRLQAGGGLGTSQLEFDL